MDKAASKIPLSLEVAARRKRQFWLQIILPVILVAGGVIALAVLSARGQNDQVAQWGTVSQILVVVPVILSCLLGMILLAAVVYGTSRLLGVLPGLFRQIQYYAYLVELRVRQVADKAAAPFIRSRSSVDGVRKALGRK